MNNQPTFSEAPEDATHWGPETVDHHASWYKQVGSSWSCIAVDSYRVFKSPWYGLGCQFSREDLIVIPAPVETLTEHPAGNGFTFTCTRAKPVFQMAEHSVRNGYSVKISKEPGKPWAAIVTEVEKARGFCDCNQGRLPCTCLG